MGNKASVYAQKWRRENPERHAANHRRQRLRRYGLTPQEYDVLLRLQGGRCAVCRAQPSPRKQLAIDHDHESKARRGLLCTSCNLALGLVRDDPKRLRILAEYVEVYKTE